MSDISSDELHVEYDTDFNPSIQSPNCSFPVQFYATADSFVDIEFYKRFLDNAIRRFRTSRTYKNYKGYLMELGMNRCQVLGNIDEDMADIEMHHNFLTIFDVALLITEHTIKTKGYISTFDLVMLLKEEHKNNRIPLVMLSKTVHELYHANQDFVIPAQYCFGYWQELLVKYKQGITRDIAYKCLNFIQKSMEVQEIGSNYQLANDILQLRQNILDWSYLNEYGSNMRISGVVY